MLGMCQIGAARRSGDHTGAGACDEISRWVAGRAAGAPEVHKRLLKQSEVLKRFLASRGEDQGKGGGRRRDINLPNFALFLPPHC